MSKASDTIANVKSRKAFIPTRAIDLRGKQVDDGKTLSDCNIHKESFVSMK